MDSKGGIGFKLVLITTEQFAVIEDNFTVQTDIETKIDFRFAAEKDQKLIGVFIKGIFLSGSKPFLLIESGCHFAISEKSWENMYDQKLNKLNVTQHFLQQLSILTVGTTRGILHAKTENTPFNQYHIPLVNVEELIKGDVALEFNPRD